MIIQIYIRYIDKEAEGAMSFKVDDQAHSTFRINDFRADKSPKGSMSFLVARRRQQAQWVLG